MVVTTVALWFVLLCAPTGASATKPPACRRPRDHPHSWDCHGPTPAAWVISTGLDEPTTARSLSAQAPCPLAIPSFALVATATRASAPVSTFSPMLRSVLCIVSLSRESSYGPSPKDCSDCHDSHGAARTASDTPYPALLRAREGTGAVYAGDAYCDTCHKNRPGDLWSGISVWKQTAHADIAATSSGTEIVCSACHAPHGSINRALVVEQLTPPSAPATATVTANDRTLCFGCHPDGLATYEGTAVTRGRDTAPASRRCQSAPNGSRVCPTARRTPLVLPVSARRHASMGRDDGTGNPVPKLLKAEGPRSCYQCHGAG